MSTPHRPAPSVHTRGFTQPVFVSRYRNRSRRVRTASRMLALLAAAWAIAAIVGSMGFMLTRDAGSSLVNLPTAQRADCPGTYTASAWRLGGGKLIGNRWQLSVYADRSQTSAQIAGACAAASALLPVLTAAAHPAAQGLRCKGRTGDGLIVHQSACVAGPAGRRTGFSWYPAITPA